MRNRGRDFRRIMLATGTALIAQLPFGTAALAQEGMSASGTSGTGDIIVTAQRRAERLEDVPASITAVTAEMAESRGVRALQDLGQTVAGVQINFQGSFTYPAVRGISSLTTGVGFENNVGVYIDGFYQPDVTAINADFANLESIQVLKGPQGALYGRNATGGAILITTRRPSDVFTGKAELRYGNFDEKTGSFYVSGPANDRLRYSVALFGTETDGYYDFINAEGRKAGKAAPAHTYSARVKLEGDLTENLLVTIGHNFTEYADVRGSMFTNEEHRFLLPPKVGRLYEPRTFASNRGPEASKGVTKVHETTLKLGWDIGIGELTSYTGYAHRNFDTSFDFDASHADLSFQVAIYDQETFQQSLDLNIDTIPGFTLVTGASYYRDNTTTQASIAFSGNRQNSLTRTQNRVEAIAAYLDGSYEIAPRLTLGFGARYTHEKRGLGYTATVFPAVGTPTTTAIPADVDNSAKFSNFSPRGVLTYEVADRTNIYASVSRGFRSGFLQALGVTQTTPTGNVQTVIVNRIQPETITAFEVGFKTASSAFRFDMSGFYYDYSNIQIGLSLPNPLCATCGPINIIDNAPKAEIYGVEGQASADLFEGFSVNASATYLHARYKEFPGVTAVGLNTTTGLNVANQVQDWSGKQMARAPEFTATFGVDYAIRNVFGGSLTFNANAKYTSSYVLNSPALYGPLAPGLEDKQRYRQGSYTVVNAALNWTDPSDTYTIGVYARNLTDVDYRLSRNGSVFGDYGAWAAPRQYGVRLGAQW